MGLRRLWQPGSTEEACARRCDGFSWWAEGACGGFSPMFFFLSRGLLLGPAWPGTCGRPAAATRLVQAGEGGEETASRSAFRETHSRASDPHAVEGPGVAKGSFRSRFVFQDREPDSPRDGGSQGRWIRNAPVTRLALGGACPLSRHPQNGCVSLDLPHADVVNGFSEETHVEEKRGRPARACPQSNRKALSTCTRREVRGPAGQWVGVPPLRKAGGGLCGPRRRS